MLRSSDWSPWVSRFLGGLWLLFAANLRADDLGVKVPDGFEVIEYASDELAHDIYSLTIDSKGRVVVAGAGYVKILVDNDQDGKADEAKLFSELPANGAQGMYFNGRALVCIGDGGILKFKDANEDDKADGPPEMFLKLKTGGEHDVHSVQEGPDGYWYVIAGNSASISSKYATTPSSPIKSPRAGVILRFSPDLKEGEILAEGLRNAYDFAFNRQGDLFTYDSDEEREISLPWYRPIRVSHSLIASDHGWVSKSWMRRDGYFDMPPVLASFGRGSPTGVVCYRHTQFPEKYRGGLFVLDWTYGRVHALPIKLANETWSTEPELFMSGTGQNGFAPTDLEVGPDGSIYLCVGGRGTRGGVYRIRYIQPKEPKSAEDEPVVPETVGRTEHKPELLNVLTAPQPLSSWSRAVWKPVALELGPLPFKAAMLDEGLAVASRLRAIEILVELFHGVDATTLKTLHHSSTEEVRARAIWAYGRTVREPREGEVIQMYLDDSSPLVARCTLEALLSFTEKDFDWSRIVVSLARRLGGPDRFNRTLAAAVVARMNDKLLPALSTEATKLGPRAVVSYAMGWFVRSTDNARRVRSVIPPLAMAVLKRSDSTTELKLDAIRLLQMALGDMGPGPERPPVFDGYSSSLQLDEFERELDPLRVQLAGLFPSGDTRMDEEMIRLIAMLTTFNGNIIDAICSGLTEESNPVDDIHRLVALARCSMTHTIKQRDLIVRALVELEEKIATRKLPQDASWADRVKEAWVKLALADEFFASAIVHHPKFGRPGHTIFLNQMPPELLPAASAAFVRVINSTEGYAWNNDVVFALGDSSESAHRELIQKQFDNFAVRGAVLVVLSRKPDPADRDKFVAGLEWSQAEVQSACLNALEILGPSDRAGEQVALVKSLRRLGADEAEYSTRERVVKLLERNNKQSFPFETGKEGFKPQPATIEKWTKWIEYRYPDQTAGLLGGQGEELKQLREDLSKIDWTSGDTLRGAELFRKRSCQQCHNGQAALGPDLAGVTSRFSLEDLYTAIVIPSRDVSTRYQTTIVSTKDGKSYTGLIVYESVDGFLLRNSTGQTFRIETSQVDEKRKSPVSLMPAGLIKGFTEQDYADLYVYLKNANANRNAK